MNKPVSLFSTALPMYMLLLMPKKWLFFLPVNLLICALAIYISLNTMGRTDLFRQMCKKELWLSWLSGFAGDLAGAGLLLGLNNLLSGGGVWADTMQAVNSNPFLSTNSLIFVFLAIIVAAAIKYLLNLWISFKKSGIDLNQKRLICLCMSMYTAPYSFLIPAFLLKFLV